MGSAPDFVGLIGTLCDFDVKFIIVGGVSAVIHGAPITTFDLDIVHARDPESLEKLLAALRDLDASYRYQTRELQPDESHLAQSPTVLPLTRRIVHVNSTDSKSPFLGRLENEKITSNVPLLCRPGPGRLRHPD